MQANGTTLTPCWMQQLQSREQDTWSHMQDAPFCGHPNFKPQSHWVVPNPSTSHFLKPYAKSYPLLLWSKKPRSVVSMYMPIKPRFGVPCLKITLWGSRDCKSPKDVTTYKASEHKVLPLLRARQEKCNHYRSDDKWETTRGYLHQASHSTFVQPTSETNCGMANALQWGGVT